MSVVYMNTSCRKSFTYLAVVLLRILLSISSSPEKYNYVPKNQYITIVFALERMIFNQIMSKIMNKKKVTYNGVVGK